MNIHTYKDLDLDKFNQFGKSLGEKLKGGETFVFSSDLGGGKTTLTKYLLKFTTCNLNNLTNELYCTTWRTSRFL